ncbi:MAG: hypothetical protein IJT56_00580 [Clostridia bacterium]|nr:hypothetical protein [Clostridia bacterium]
MIDKKQLIGRWKADYDFKTLITADVSLGVTAAFALYNGFLGVHHQSLWHGTICVYYIILVLLRGGIVFSERIAYKRDDGGRVRKICRGVSSALLLILNISLIVPIALMVKMEKPVGMTLIPAIAMAAYTTYKIVMASVNLRRRKRSSDILVRLLRTIGFIEALVSILTLQNTLIMVNSGGGSGAMLTLTALTSGAIWLGILIISAMSAVDMRLL